MRNYILSIDQSTSTTKAIIFNKEGRLICRSNIDHCQYYPQTGWVEHDAEEIYSNMLKAIREVLNKSNISLEMIKGISITNQRETVVVWDKKTGKPIYNAIVWQCQRAEQICSEISDKGYGNMIKERTGLVLSPYFSAAKVKWLLDNVEGARSKANHGDLLMGTMDSWLIWNLTCRKVHATDYSNASRTQLFNLEKLNWDIEILKVFDIPVNMLPNILFSDEIFGFTNTSNEFKIDLPISGIMGDSHAALFGQNCFEKSMTKVTYGTGSSMMMNIGNIPLKSEKGLVTSIAWGMNGKIDYVFEGNINCTGATIKWLEEDLELITSPMEAEKLSFSVESNGGVYIVPAFVGLSAPYWDSKAKASITGITRGTKRAHIVRAAEESIAYQIKDLLGLMIEESASELTELRVDGGPIRDAFLMQFQSDILKTKVICSKIEELSALGSCYMAGLALGIWNGKDELNSLREQGKVYYPSMPDYEKESLYMGWKEAVRRTLTRY